MKNKNTDEVVQKVTTTIFKNKFDINMATATIQCSEQLVNGLIMDRKEVEQVAEFFTAIYKKMKDKK